MPDLKGTGLLVEAIVVQTQQASSQQASERRNSSSCFQHRSSMLWIWPRGSVKFLPSFGTRNQAPVFQKTYQTIKSSFQSAPTLAEIAVCCKLFFVKLTPRHLSRIMFSSKSSKIDVKNGIPPASSKFFQFRKTVGQTHKQKQLQLWLVPVLMPK